MSLDDHLAVNVRKPRPSHPKGWNPGEIEWDPGRNRGYITADPTTPGGSPQFTSLLAELCENIGEDPADYEIVGQVQVRRWKSLSPDGPVWLYYHRATIQKRAGTAEGDVDVDALLREVSRRKTRKAPVTSTTGAGLVVAMGDWQVGKSDGDGVQGTIDRLGRIPDLIEQRWRALRKIGVPLEVVYLCFGGDLREGCTGHYAQQAFRTALNHREQRKIIRTSADRIIDAASSLAPVAVKVVGGNHGEERIDGSGRSSTDFADNVDVAVIEDIAYAYSKAGTERYANVSFAIPNDDLTLTFDHDGLVIGLAHSHQAGFGSGDPRTKIHNWWKGQMDGQQPIGDADVLVTFHWHHPWVIQRGSRTQIGCGALDGGSDWFRSSSGQDAPPSTTSFVVTGSGWDHYRLLGGPRS
jgi:hypothetical protein